MDVKTPQTNHLSIALYEEKKRETYLPDMHIIRCQRLVINYEMMTQKEKFTSFRRSSIFISFFTTCRQQLISSYLAMKQSGVGTVSQSVF